MKANFTSKDDKLKVISASLLAGTFIISGCSNSLNKNNGDSTTQASQYRTTDSNITESTETLPEISETTEEPKNYDIMWGDSASQDFSNYLEKN